MVRKMHYGACECGSRESVERHDGVFCRACGLELRGVEMDPGFAPSPSVSRGSDSFLGSLIGTERGREMTRLKRTQSSSSRKKPSFMDDLASQVRGSGEESRVSEEAIALLREVDSGRRLGLRRKSLMGATGMSRPVARDYRLSVFAAAALHILNDSGKENRAPMVSEKWGICYNDIAWAISILNRHRRRDEKRGFGVTPEAIRRSGLGSNLNRLREFLATKVGFGEAGDIMQSAETRLSDQGEPLGDSEEWLSGRFCNMPSKRAAMVAFAEEMMSRGKPKGMVRWLREEVPIIGTKDFVARIGIMGTGDGEE